MSVVTSAANAVKFLARIARSVGLVVDPGTWIIPNRVLACANPRRSGALHTLAAQGISLIVNLHERPHPGARLQPFNLRQIHLPVADFTAPSEQTLDRGVAAIADAVRAGRKVAVHCGGGLGRTGTLLACYLVSEGMAADAAIAQVRRLRPGSIETAAQAASVFAFEAKQRHQPRTEDGQRH